MKLRVPHRVVDALLDRRPRKRLSEVSVDVELACLTELRSELRASYPHIRTDRLIAIAGDHGLSEFPAGFLIAGSLRSSAARAALGSVHRSADGTVIDAHPLFSQSFYSLANPDVAGSGVPPWLHYQVYGRPEGRSPHPLIDTAFLSSWLPGVAVPDLVDRYLTDPSLWRADPGPYVDCRKFMVDGPWDSVTNPLLQIVAAQLVTPWVHRRLQLVDADSSDVSTARLTGAAFLLGATDATARLATLDRWELSPASVPAEPTTFPESTTFTVVPGFFLAANGSVIRSDQAALVSADSTVIRLSTEALSVRSGETITAPELLYLEGPTAYTRLVGLVAGLAPGAAIAPHSEAHYESLRMIASELQSLRPDLRVLRPGRQVRVTADSLRREAAPADVTIGAFTPSTDAEPLAIALVLTESEWAAASATFAPLVAAGALPCLVGTSGLTPWLPLIRSRSIVACSPALLESIGAFVPSDTLRLLVTNGAQR